MRPIITKVISLGVTGNRQAAAPTARLAIKSVKTSLSSMQTTNMPSTNNTTKTAWAETRARHMQEQPEKGTVAKLIEKFSSTPNFPPKKSE